jgi:Zn ribbon nucleic-acid-binding protein
MRVEREKKMDRGYKVGRAVSPHRRGHPGGECPQCGKRGVTQWKAVPGAVIRYCRYCQHHERKP